MQTFAPAGHFYSPIPSQADIDAHAAKLRDGGVELPRGIDFREPQQLEFLKSAKPFYDVQPFADRPSATCRYGFINDAYSYSDALFYYFVLRTFTPKRIIEIGSGHSTCVAMDARDLFLGPSTSLTCIEPYPKLLQSLMRGDDAARVNVIATKLQDVHLDVFAALEANDILFVDSTHVSKLGSDVNRIIFDILPSLAPGVLIHFHDIFYPFDYPLQWHRQGRVWTETYVLRAFLAYNNAFEIIAFNTFLEERHRELFARDFPLCLKNTGGSIWLRKTG